MNYEIIDLPKKIIAGCSARTNNSSPDMSAVIGGVWQKFYSDDVYANIPYKLNEKALGIYTDYENNENGDYTVMAGCEVSQKDITGNFEVCTIPAGKYAKFVIRGHMQKAVADFWQELWNMKLDRSYVCDFEEYQNSSIDDCEIHIYIGLRTDKATEETDK